MTAPRIALMACLFLAACANAPFVDTPVLPADTFANYPGVLAPMTIDESALYDAGIVLGNNGPRPVDPARAAHAVASIEYLAGAMNTGPYWIGVDPLAAQLMILSRQEIRQALGAAPNARSQDVVNVMLAASRAQSPAGMAAALNSPVFPQGGQATYERLAALDQLPITRRAIPQASRARYYLNKSPEFPVY